MSKIRVIDLLNKIANGEEVPEKIKYKNELYVFNKNTETIDDLYRLNHEEGIDWLSHANVLLDDTVEIIEEEPEINIQSIEEQGQFCNLIGLTENEEILWKMIQSNANVIDEVIRAAKQLDRQINNK